MSEATNVKDLPGCFKPFVFHWDDQQLKDELGLGGTEHADHYGHSVMCTHFVVESKSKGKISKAIRQLENTVQALEKKGRKIDRVVIYCDKLSKTDSRVYEVRKVGRAKEEVRHYLYDKNFDKQVEIPTPKNRYPIEIIYRGS